MNSHNPPSNQLYPLHPSQLEIYYDQLIDEKSPGQNLGGYLILKGILDPEHFGKAISSLNQDIDSFRIRIVIKGDTPFLSLSEASIHPLDCCDFSGEKLPQEEAGRWVQERFNHTFDLYKNRLWEHYLLKISDEEHWYYFKAHHLIMDAFGAINLAKYIAVRYNVLQAGQIVGQYNELPTYTSEINTILDYFKTEPYHKAARYWKEKFTRYGNRFYKANIKKLK